MQAVFHFRCGARGLIFQCLRFLATARSKAHVHSFADLRQQMELPGCGKSSRLAIYFETPLHASQGYAEMRRISTLTLSGPPRSSAIFTSSRHACEGEFVRTAYAGSCSRTRLQSPSVQRTIASPSCNCIGVSGS